MSKTAVLDRPVENKPKPPEPLATGGFGNKKPPKRPVGYARDPDDESDADETTIDPWNALGLENPFT
jgi:hypothetical protein